MQRLARPLGILIGTQAICLAVGFWFQYALVITTIEGEAAETAWSALKEQSSAAISSARYLAANSLDRHNFSKVVPHVSLDEDPAQPAFLLTDSDGGIMGFTKAASQGKWRQGERINWKPDREPATPEEPRLGRIVTPLGERLAISYSLDNQNCQIVVYETMPTAGSWKRSLETSFAQSSGLGFFWTLTLSAVAFCLLMSHFNFQTTQQKAELDHDALRNAQDLIRTRDAVIFGLAKLAESRDPETGHHLERISLYTTRLGTALRPYPKFQRIVTPTFVRLLGISSVLHDIGKVGVEDTVLLKPGKLNDNEFRIRFRESSSRIRILCSGGPSNERGSLIG